jgi:hypothetical protein
MSTWSFYLSKKPQLTRKVWQVNPHTPNPENKVQTLDCRGRALNAASRDYDVELCSWRENKKFVVRGMRMTILDLTVRWVIPGVTSRIWNSVTWNNPASDVSRSWPANSLSGVSFTDCTYRYRYSRFLAWVVVYATSRGEQIEPLSSTG